MTVAISGRTTAIKNRILAKTTGKTTATADLTIAEKAVMSAVINGRTVTAIKGRIRAKKTVRTIAEIIGRNAVTTGAMTAPAA